MAATPSIVLLQSTFTCLLEVGLDAEHRLLSVRTVDEGHGVYFGLTRHGDYTYAVARNVDAMGKIVDPAFPTHNVLSLRQSEIHRGKQSWPIPDTRGVHQIRWRDGLLWMMNCRVPELVAFDPERDVIVGSVCLSELVPAEFQHPVPTEHPTDRYHFNSLYFTSDRLFVLAHNWGYGSFALELEYLSSTRLLSRPRVTRTHTGLGNQSHDIHVESGRLYVLDSANSRVLISDSDGTPITTPSSSQHFARGLAVSREFFYVGHGVFGTREDRMTGPTQISVLNRKTLQLVATIEVGRFGNPCDLLLVSETDLSDVVGSR